MFTGLAIAKLQVTSAETFHEFDTGDLETRTPSPFTQIAKTLISRWLPSDSKMDTSPH